MKLIGIYAYIDGREADVFRFYGDGTYLFSLLKHGPNEPPLTLWGLVAVESWRARETYPGTTKHAGQVAGTFTLDGSTVTLTRTRGTRPSRSSIAARCAEARSTSKRLIATAANVPA